MSDAAIEVVTVTPNPAIDWTLTVPDFAAGRLNRVAAQRASAGGKGVNVAAALAGYGHRVAVTGFLGRENAALFEEFFARATIADHFQRIAGETRTGIKIADPARQETTDVNFPGAAPATADVEALSGRVAELARRHRPWFVLAGSLPPGVEPTLYRELAELLKREGCRVAVDASGDALRHALEAAPHLVKPNIHELEALVGERLLTHGAVVAAASAILATGVELVVVSMGEEGALFVDAERTLLARPPRVTVHSTVGAGDAMVAGILAGRLGGLSPADTARLATAFSLDALGRDETGITSRQAVDALTARVQVEAQV